MTTSARAIDKRNLLFTAGLSAGLGFLAVPAFACTILLGTLTVHGGGGTSVVVHKNGNMNIGCVFQPGAQAVVSNGDGLPPGVPATSALIEVIVKSEGCGPPLPDGIYEVNFQNIGYRIDSLGAYSFGTGADDTDCMAPLNASSTNNPTKNLGTITVSGGFVQGFFSIPHATPHPLFTNDPVGPGHAGAICVSNGFEGQQAPINVTVI